MTLHGWVSAATEAIGEENESGDPNDRENTMPPFKWIVTLASVLLLAVEAGAQSVQGLVHLKVNRTSNELAVSSLGSFQAIRDLAGRPATLLCGALGGESDRAGDSAPPDKGGHLEPRGWLRQGDAIQRGASGKSFALSI